MIISWESKDNNAPKSMVYCKYIRIFVNKKDCEKGKCISLYNQLLMQKLQRIKK